MHHAVGALLVLARAVGIPVGRLHQFLETRCIALSHEVAGLLPAEDVAGGITPRRAVIALVAGQEVEVEARLIEDPLAPLLAAFAEDVAEQRLGLAAVEEMHLI